MEYLVLFLPGVVKEFEVKQPNKGVFMIKWNMSRCFEK